MRVPDHPALIRRMLDARLKRLGSFSSPILAATLVHFAHRCGRQACRCHHGGPLHPSQQLTFKVASRTRTVYVPKDLLPEVHQWLAAHQRLQSLPQEIQQLSLALVRTHARHRRRQAGRP